jgi:threonine dehydratase
MTGTRYCYSHHPEQARRARKNAERVRQRWFESAPLEDAASVQRALMQVMTRLLSGNIGYKQAGQILYKLQTASVNLRSAALAPGRADDESSKEGRLQSDRSEEESVLPALERKYVKVKSDETPVRPTTILESPRLEKRLGITLTLATETFQCTGSFKFRAAYNVASHVPQKMIIAASSGNFGQAMAYACSLLGKSCTIVMPMTSAKVKVEAVLEYGGEVDLVDVRVKSRGDRVRELSQQYPEAYIASAYDDPLVIEGNATLGMEIGALERPLDIVVAPVGGGGLISGVITGLKQSRKKIEVVGAEPLLGNDAARSLRAGHIVANESEPQTIADGARTVSLGKHDWAVMQGNLSTIVEVPEEKIIEAVRLLFEFANLKVEPTGALGLAAVLTQPDLFRGRAVCCVISGGNVDPGVYASMLNG